jgi:hypothetical protein
VERFAAAAGADVRRHRISSLEEARSERFLASPTVRVDGRDVEPGADERTEFALGCRLYRTPSRVEGSPAEHWIATALDAAVRC